MIAAIQMKNQKVHSSTSQKLFQSIQSMLIPFHA